MYLESTVRGGRHVFVCAMVAAVAALLLASSAIYPEDHWSYSTKLTEQSFDGFIKDSVDAGKTAFVRWIASEG